MFMDLEKDLTSNKFGINTHGIVLFVVPLVLNLCSLCSVPCLGFAFSFFRTYSCSLMVFLVVYFLVLFCFSFCVFNVFCTLFVSVCAGFGGWYLHANEVLPFRLRMGSVFKILEFRMVAKLQGLPCFLSTWPIH